MIHTYSTAVSTTRMYPGWMPWCLIHQAERRSWVMRLVSWLSVLLLFVAVSAGAQSLHVTAVRHLQPTDPAPVSRAFEVFVVTGMIDGKTYSLQQMKSWGTHLVQVGQDYPVLKLTDRTLDVTVTDKKGKAWKENLDVTGVSE